MTQTTRSPRYAPQPGDTLTIEDGGTVRVFTYVGTAARPGIIHVTTVENGVEEGREWLLETWTFECPGRTWAAPSQRDARFQPAPGDVKTYPNGSTWTVLEGTDDGVYVRVDGANTPAYGAHASFGQWAKGGSTLAGEKVSWHTPAPAAAPAPAPAAVQPPPAPGTGDVWMDLIVAEPSEDIRTLYAERRAVGTARYGVPLQYGNGRDYVRDLREELLDALAYAKGSGRDDLLGPIRGTLALLRSGPPAPTPCEGDGPSAPPPAPKRTAEDARRDPQPGDTYTFAGRVRDVATVERVGVDGDHVAVEVRCPRLWGTALGRWPLAAWSSGPGVWAAGGAS